MDKIYQTMISKTLDISQQRTVEIWETNEETPKNTPVY